ncbi:disulfide bond formation protein B [Parvibaculum sp.]|uniref:disulfide bond formation protein B n=1 Tax=Parvibaculum sp. TaxID=2024848 RepID=UPI0027310D50|nr:disulfide bond formation protein B [Parvibaculum sp.]MDP1625720.1 disulfide bond formation protein B [Parvibaculum sp.]MDP2149083.1 disulfide bond formation protein B [Parvibaculum sp.]MDP3328378.1 disulfide bond formation protein B [Parvibaculum sp.]
MTERIPSNAIPWILIAVSVATLAGALFFEHVLGYVPCSLCLQGRQPHYFAIGAALIAGILSREANIGIGVLVFLGLCLLAYLAGAGLSFYHVGVEYKWWPGPDTCGAGGLVANSLEDLQSALHGGAKAPRCDDAAWRLFGISLAGFNMLITLALAALSALPLLRYFRESRGEV